MEVFKHITDNRALIWTEIDVIPDCLKYVFSVTLTSIQNLTTIVRFSNF